MRPIVAEPQYTHGDEGPEHDGNWSGAPHVSYFICSVARSGSTLLGSLLWDTGLAGKPLEYFNPVHAVHFIARWRSWSIGSNLPRRYWDAIRQRSSTATNLAVRNYARDLIRYRTTPNGRFGVKLHFQQYEDQLGLQPLESLFPNLRYISITRPDRVGQAISWWRASQTGVWADGDVKRKEASYSFGGILRRHCEILREEQGWDDFFAERGISPLRVVYDELARNPAETIQSVLRFLDVDAPPNTGQARTKKQSNSSKAQDLEWRERYLKTLGERGLRLAPAAASLQP